MFKKVEVFSSSFRFVGQVLICCFRSREPAGPVKDGALDTRLVDRSACRYLGNLLQQSPNVYQLLLISTTSKGWKPESSLSARELNSRAKERESCALATRPRRQTAM